MKRKSGNASSIETYLRKWLIELNDMYLLHVEATFPMMFAQTHTSLIHECVLNERAPVERVISLRFTSLLSEESIRWPVLRGPVVSIYTCYYFTSDRLPFLMEYKLIERL